MIIKKMALLLMLSLGSGVALLAQETELHKAVIVDNVSGAIGAVFAMEKTGFFGKKPLVDKDYFKEQNNMGYTALHVAASNGNHQAVSMLLEKEKELNSGLGFAINISLLKSGQPNKSPIDLAMELSDQGTKEAIVTLFKQHITSQNQRAIQEKWNFNPFKIEDMKLVLAQIEKVLKPVPAPAVVPGPGPVAPAVPARSVSLRASNPAPKSSPVIARKLSNPKPISEPAPAPAPSSTPKPNPSPERTETSNPTIVESPSPRPAPAPASAPSVAPPARKNTASVKRTEPSVPTEDGNVDKVVDNVPNPDNGNSNVPKTEEPKADEPMSTGKKIAIGGAVVTVSAVIYLCYQVYAEFQELEKKNEEVKEEEQFSTSELMGLAFKKTLKKSINYFSI